jgi:hypothetical protein
VVIPSTKIVWEEKGSAASAASISGTLLKGNKDTLKECRTKLSYSKLSKKGEKAASKLSENFWERDSSNDVCLLNGILSELLI